MNGMPSYKVVSFPSSIIFSLPKRIGGSCLHRPRERDRKTGLPDFKSLTLLLTKSASPLFTTLFRPVRVFWNNYSLHICTTLLSMVWSYSRGRAMRILHNDQCHFSLTYVYATLWHMQIFCSTMKMFGKVWTGLNKFEKVWTWTSSNKFEWVEKILLILP